jgi:hypothetical protein
MTTPVEHPALPSRLRLATLSRTGCIAALGYMAMAMFAEKKKQLKYTDLDYV